MGFAALIPDDYLGDVHQRLLFYKRISNTDTQDKLDNIRMEIIDRFGVPPVQVKQLFSVHQLRIKAEHLGITKIDLGSNGGHIEFSPDTPVQAISIIQMRKKFEKFFLTFLEECVMIIHVCYEFHNRNLWLRFRG